MWEEPLLVGDHSCCCGQTQEGRHTHKLEESSNRWQVSFPKCGDKRPGWDILRKGFRVVLVQDPKQAFFLKFVASMKMFL